MEERKIETRLVCGFLDAGKTSYIRDCVMNDVFYKRGTTLILCFEQGEEEYDEAALSGRRTFVSYYEEGQDVRAFCEEAVEKYRPDRVYVEMNAMMPELRGQLPECLKISFVSALFDWAALPLYLVNLRQIVGQIVREAHQVTFRGCPSKELLAPYGETFRLMNAKASYLRQDPMGYHEKAFDLFVPFSLDAPEITISRREYIPLWLDALDHPEHYEGKLLRFTDPLEIRQAADGSLSTGLVVMTCCMADLQFMSFALDMEASEHAPEQVSAKVKGQQKTAAGSSGWFRIDARANVCAGEYGRRSLHLQPEALLPAQAPAELIFKPGEA
ncbi:MAG: hypothetical protein IJL47_07420 [Lachnospiraceae bacterium]|nr:hypothetical protein [Lachnospiraceae bacterium]MBQ6197468.1 hypothetical protein [Lachnospiraceae bacterium]